MYFVYIIENISGSRYIGSTNSLENRILMHNDVSLEKSKFHRTTYKKGPWKLIFSEKFTTRKEALDFEKFLKTGRGRDWIKDNAY